MAKCRLLTSVICELYTRSRDFHITILMLTWTYSVTFCTSTILFDAQLSVQYKVYRDARDSENVYHEFMEDAAIEDSRKIALNYLPAYT